MVRTRGLYHIHINVSDLSRSMRFYQQVFGLKEMFREGSTMAFLRTPGCEDTITLSEVKAPDQVGRAGIDHFGFKLETKADLDAAIREVEAAGGKLLGRGEHQPGFPYIYVADPDGYVIEINA